MKVLVLGATGKTGQLIVRDLTEAGHHVVALVRATADVHLPGAEVVVGDVRDEETLARASVGCDAVVSALGTGMGVREVDLLTVATGALIAAMGRAGVHRLICISALGVGDSRNHGGFVFDWLIQPLLLGHAYKDKERQEAAIRASSLDWVIIRPAMLTTGRPRGRISATTDLEGVHGGKVARADVAQFVVQQLTSDTWLRRTPVIL